MKNNLITDRLILKKPTLNDIESYEKIHNSDFVLKYNPMNKKSTEDIIKEFETNDTMWLIETTEGFIIGAIFLEQDSLRFWDKSIEISFFLDENYTEQGYMSEALNKVIPYLFTELQIEIITVRVFSENTASLKLIEKLNFHQDGYLRKCVNHNNIVWDDVLFSLTKKEFCEK